MGTMYFKCNQACILHDEVITIERDCFLTDNISSKGSTLRSTSSKYLTHLHKTNPSFFREKRLQSLERLKTSLMIQQPNQTNLLNSYYINSIDLANNKSWYTII